MRLRFDPPAFKVGETKEFYVRFTSPREQFFPIFSWAIKIYDWWFDASHVQIMWLDNWHDEWLVYEASGTNVHFVGRVKQETQPWEIVHNFKITVTALSGWKTVKWCEAHAGLSYDLWAILGFIPVKIAAIFGKEIKNPWGKGETEQFCSEMVGFIMRDLWDYSIQGDLNKAGPKLLFDYLLDASKRFDNVVKVK